MNKFYWILVFLLIASPFLIILFLLSDPNNNTNTQDYEEKLYVALEADGRVGVIDAKSKKFITAINLANVQNNTFVKYTAHNVQVSPNGQKVLVTANVNRGSMGSDGKDEKQAVADGLLDQVFIIDPLTDTIKDSIAIDSDMHLAHVVFNAASDIAYVASQEKGLIYAMDLNVNRVIRIFDLGENSQPHGLRMQPDDSKLFVALIGKKSLVSLDIRTGEIESFPLSGAVIQTAVTPDGQYGLATVYDSKKIAWVDLQSGQQGYIDLPIEAKGPVQIYTTPDSRYAYVADQGYYFDQPTANTVYRINIRQKIVDQTITVGTAPHGVVVNKAGTLVYVTNLLSDDLSVIDVATSKEVARVAVGEMPNGVSIWNKQTGGTP
jgi:YVTN family beta-propeller protein